MKQVVDIYEAMRPAVELLDVPFLLESNLILHGKCDAVGGFGKR